MLIERQRTPTQMLYGSPSLDKHHINRNYTATIEIPSGDIDRVSYARDDSATATPVPASYNITPRKLHNNKFAACFMKWWASSTHKESSPLPPPTMNLPRHRYSISNLGSRMPHMVYSIADIENVEEIKRAPTTFMDKLAITMVKTVVRTFNLVTRFNCEKLGAMSKEKWVTRAVFLESVAAVPGMIAAMLRHLKSLRLMQRDHGWIRHLLEEADNERMHLFFFLREKNPGLLFRVFVWFAQVGFFAMNIIFYIISPKTMHRFVGYLEEEAVHTYNAMVREIENSVGALHEWKSKPAPRDMAAYYCLDSGATYRDIVLCIRADEVGHREHNHLFSDLHGDNTEQHYPHGDLQLVRCPDRTNQYHGISLTEV